MTYYVLAGVLMVYGAYRVGIALADAWMASLWKKAAATAEQKARPCDACGDRVATIETTITFTTRQLQFHACLECSSRMKRMVWTDSTGYSRGVKN